MASTLPSAKFWDLEAKLGLYWDHSRAQVPIGHVMGYSDFEFGTSPWHLVIRVKFGTCVQNWDFFGTKIRDLKRKHTTLLIYLLDA